MEFVLLKRGTETWENGGSREAVAMIILLVCLLDSGSFMRCLLVPVNDHRKLSKQCNT